MTPPDDRPPEDPGAAGPDSGGSGLDEEAAWAAIVANFGERVRLDDPSGADGHPTPDSGGPGGETGRPGAAGGHMRSPSAPEGPRPAGPADDRRRAQPGRPRRRREVRRTEDLFDRTYLDSLQARAAREQGLDRGEDAWNDEGHFVPPEPPPLPPSSRGRRAAWLALLGTPVLIPLLLMVTTLLGWTFPTWLVGWMVVAFLAGFGYLVATMPRQRPGDWPGDDGAVV